MLRRRLASGLARNLPPLIAPKMTKALYPVRLATREDALVTAKAAGGGHLRVRTSDVIGYTFTLNGFFDWRVIAVALGTCPPGGTIVEVGANIGTETIAYSRIAGPCGRVVAYEPNEANFNILREVIVGNDLGNVTILPSAVGAHSGVIHFSLPQLSNSGAGFIVNDENAKGDDQLVTVPLTTLDAERESIGSPALIVVDVEGAETTVLEGAKELLTIHRPVFVVEAIADQLLRAGTSVAELCGTFVGNGYEVFDIARLELVALDRRGIPTRPARWSRMTTQNWVAIPIERRRLVREIVRTMCIAGLVPGFLAARLARRRILACSSCQTQSSRSCRTVAGPSPNP
jgi:FkbM family methyltransferase